MESKIRSIASASSHPISVWKLRFNDNGRIIIKKAGTGQSYFCTQTRNHCHNNNLQNLTWMFFLICPDVYSCWISCRNEAFLDPANIALSQATDNGTTPARWRLICLNIVIIWLKSKGRLYLPYESSLSFQRAILKMTKRYVQKYITQPYERLIALTKEIRNG